MKLIVVRHGESIGNKKKISLGQMRGRFSGLSKNGVKQIKDIAKKLKNERIDIIFSSPLERARRTAEEIAKFHSADIIVDNLLMERNFGCYEGKPKALFLEHMKKSKKPFHLFSPKGVESMKDISLRAKMFLDKIKENYPNENILVVSHRLFIRALIGTSIFIIFFNGMFFMLPIRALIKSL